MGWSPDGSLLAVAAGERVYVYGAVDLAPRQTLALGVWANRLAFRPAAQAEAVTPYLLALANTDGSLQFWDAASGQQLCAIYAHRNGANGLAFRPDGLVLASAGNDGMLRLWDLASLDEGGQTPADCQVVEQAEIIGGAYAVPAVAFSPDGALLAAVDLHNIRLREPATQLLVRTLNGSTSMFTIAFSPDGSLLAAGELGNTLRLWEVQSGEERLALSQPAPVRTFIWSLAFSPDGRWLAAGGSDGWVRLWELPSGTLVYAARLHSAAVTGLAFSPDGRVLASGGLDAVVWVNWVEELVSGFFSGLVDENIPSANPLPIR